MNESIASADRATHVKIVVVALAAASIVVAVGMNARVAGSGLASRGIHDNGSVVKADKRMNYSSRAGAAIR